MVLEITALSHAGRRAGARRAPDWAIMPMGGGPGMVANIVGRIVALIAVAALVLYVIGLYNTFVRLALADDQAFANIDLPDLL